MTKHLNTAQPDYAKYAELEITKPGGWAQLLRQLSRFSAPESALAMILIAALAAAIEYHSGLTRGVQVIVFPALAVLGIIPVVVPSKRDPPNAPSSPKATESQIEP